MLERIDNILNSITMYRLTLYYLIALVSFAVLISFFNLLPFTFIDILLSTGVALISCYLANFVFSKIFKAVTNVESVFITTLILVLIIPSKMPANLLFIAFASVLAMASKYLFTIQKRHLLNPAAIGVAYIALFSPSLTATWWIGTPAMLPLVVLGGILLSRKIRREKMVLTYLFVYLSIVLLTSLIRNPTAESLINAIKASTTHTAVFFFAFIMLTEPLTSPVTKNLQIIYAAIVGVLSATPQIRLGIVFTPELSLLVGNIFSYIVSPKYRLNLTLKAKNQLTHDTVEFVFANNENFSFTAGQYMEWTLPHVSPDNRGVRRYFSLANSPTEKDLMLLVKFYNPASSYKRNLYALEPGKEIIASQLAGDFVLPTDINKPLVLVSGGVGVAPFRSMIKYIVDNKLRVNIIHLFANRNLEDIVYKPLFDEAESYGVHTVYILTNLENIPLNWNGEKGHISTEMVQRVIPDFSQRKFYVSGPQLMVQTIEETLLSSGLTKKQIKTDFFPGYIEKGK